MVSVCQYPSEADGHRAPLADLLNQLSLSSDCCHFVTICDGEDSSSSDSDTSNDSGSLVVGSLIDECVVTGTADVASLPAVSVPPAVSLSYAAGSSVRDMSGVSATDRCSVRHSPILFDAVNGSATMSTARGDHDSNIQPSIAESCCQHLSKSC